MALSLSRSRCGDLSSTAPGGRRRLSPAVNASDALPPVFTSVEQIMMRSQNRRSLSGYFLPAALAALWITAWVAAVPASGQSFDCRNARYTDEKTICRESRLGELDKELSAAYDKAGGKLSKQQREDFEKNETAFVNARHRCGEHQGCIEQSYRNRLRELQSALPDDASDRSGRGSSSKRSDRQKASGADRENTDERVKTESAGPQETTPVPSEAPAQPAERKIEQTEVKPAAPLPGPPSPAEKRSVHKETATAGSAPSASPSRDEAQAAIEGAAVPEKRSRHEKRSRQKDGASVVSTNRASSPEHEKQPKSPAAPVSEEHAPATGSSTASAQPASPPEKRHPKAKKAAAGSSGTPASASAPAEPAKPPEPAKSAGAPSINWVDPPPSR